MRKSLILILVVLLASISNASATYIQISTTITTESVITKNETEINIQAVNLGDEPAYNVQLSLLLPHGFSSNYLYPKILYPNRTFTGTFKLNIDEDLKPGRYPIMLMVYYTDANSYPFTSISAVYLVYKEPTPVMLRANAMPIEIPHNGSGTLKIGIANIDNKPHNITLKLYLPNELRSNNYKEEIYLESSENKEIEFQISSLGALPGSTYIIFISMEYEDQLHYSSTASGTVTILKSESTADSKWKSWTLIGIAILLVLIFAYYQFKK